MITHPDLATKEGACGEDHCLGAIGAAEIGVNPFDLCIFARIAFNFEACHHRLAQGQVWGVLQQLLHLAGVLAFIRLSAQGPYRRAAAGIKHPFLQCGGISKATDHPTKGIHFMHQLAFGGPTYGWIAGLPGDAIQVERKKGCINSKPSSGEGCLATGMAATNHN